MTCPKKWTMKKLGMASFLSLVLVIRLRQSRVGLGSLTIFGSGLDQGKEGELGSPLSLSWSRWASWSPSFAYRAPESISPQARIPLTVRSRGTGDVHDVAPIDTFPWRCHEYPGGGAG